MAASLSNLATELIERTAWQRIPIALEMNDYVRMIVSAIEMLYVDTGRASQYNAELITETDDDTVFTNDLSTDEKAYVLILAQINFYRRVQTDVNNVMSYSTDALSVTNADKPYMHLQDTIANLEKDKRVVYYKMSRFCLLT